MCLAFGVDQPRRRRPRSSSRRARDAAAAGARREGQGPEEAEVDRRLAARRRCARARQEVVLTGDDVDLDLLPIQHCWPGDPAPFITLPAVITHDPQDRHAQRRHVPHAEARPRSTLDALADAQGRPHGLPGDRRPARGRRRARASTRSAPTPPRRRSRSTSTSSCSPASSRASRSSSCKCKTVDVEVPANAEIVLEGYVRAGRPDAWRARSATTRATTRPPSRSRSSTSPR